MLLELCVDSTAILAAHKVKTSALCNSVHIGSVIQMLRRLHRTNATSFRSIFFHFDSVLGTEICQNDMSVPAFVFGTPHFGEILWSASETGQSVSKTTRSLPGVLWICAIYAKDEGWIIDTYWPRIKRRVTAEWTVQGLTRSGLSVKGTQAGYATITWTLRLKVNLGSKQGWSWTIPKSVKLVAGTR